uniref:Uncharacterized protein n=1 Tax=Chrysotila carterae TaxID=13221 RepID=A0A7S4B7W2_CHRCT
MLCMSSSLSRPVPSQESSSATSSSTCLESASVMDLHREYGNIFESGNRNAASHLWASFLIDRQAQMTQSRFEMFFTGFCAISGSPLSPRDFNRYQMTLPFVGGGESTGYMYYCCWPCVCDTNDFIRVDTLNVTLADGIERTYHVAVIGDPCERPEALREPFVQPFYSRGPTTLERDAPEVRCKDGKLVGATRSQHGYIVIQLFPLAENYEPNALAQGAVPPKPGRLFMNAIGQRYQDEGEYAIMCHKRAENGYNSGMGEIFRRVAAISPVGARALAGDENGSCQEGALPVAATAEELTSSQS